MESRIENENRYEFALSGAGFGKETGGAMTQQELQELKPGDMIRHARDGNMCIVLSSWPDTIVAVRKVTVTHAPEWERVDISEKRL